MTELASEAPAYRPASHLAAKWQRPEILEAIFDQLSDALFIYDKDLHIVGVNQSAQRLFGIRRKIWWGSIARSYSIARRVSRVAPCCRVWGNRPACPEGP